MARTINGWKEAVRTDTVLGSGANHNVESQEHLVLIPPESGVSVTGFIPPTLDGTWLMSVSNGGVENITLTNDDVGSDAGQRTLMLPGYSSYTLASGQTVWMVFTPNLDFPAFQGWFPLQSGTPNV